MDDNEMLSHIFLSCLTQEQLEKIKEKFVGERDWKKTSVQIPVEMKIGGVSLNPKAFFDAWRNQMQTLIGEKATALVAEKMGSEKMRDIQTSVDNIANALEYFEREITWQSENPFTDEDGNN